MSEDASTRVKNVGLHLCGLYNNIVRYNPTMCGKCPYNGLKRTCAKKEKTSS